MRRIALLLYLLNVAVICSKGQSLAITTKSGSEAEVKGKAQLERIMSKYSTRINKWIYTTNVEIDEKSIPHSHPVLTLNCNYLEADENQLANFLHEQFHYLAIVKKPMVDEAVKSFRELYPKLPAGRNLVARDEYSTYLHLVVCDLELQALTDVFGKEKAEDILESWNHYTWIYEKVLTDPMVRQINVKHGLVL